jgi:DNA-binding MarR family transcriptional regulator
VRSADRRAIQDRDYAQLAAFRYALRNFQHFSAGAAHDAGLTPNQHQALLSIKGHTGQARMTIGRLAEHLLIAPHTAAELVMRLEQDGMIEKVADETDRRRVGLRLTVRADRALRALTEIHLTEIRVMAPGLIATLTDLLDGSADQNARAKSRVAS